MARTNSTRAGDVRDGRERNHRVAVFVGALVASAACFAIVPGDTLTGSLAQTALLAAVSLLAVGLAHPQVLGRSSLRATGGLRGWIGYVLAIGLVVGCLSFGGVGVEAPWLRVAYIVALCLLTGVFEEGVFRVLAVDAFAPTLGGGRRGLLRAAAASSVLFGMLHVTLGDASTATDAVSVAQVVLKPVQAGLFGFFMAALYARTSNLWVLAAMHGVFNMLYLGPAMLGASSMEQGYVTGDPFDLALLAATVVLLVPPVLAAIRSFRRNSQDG